MNKCQFVSYATQTVFFKVLKILIFAQKKVEVSENTDFMYIQELEPVTDLWGKTSKKSSVRI